MEKILFINACVRLGSRTLELAEAVLEKIPGSVEKVNLFDIPLSALDLAGMEKRDRASRENDFSDPMFGLAKQFAEADAVVIAAPYWDMMFPAVLKIYLENITVSDITFRYTPEGIPEGLCRAKGLYYVTTAGGYIGPNHFGFSYVKALAENFFGIMDVRCFVAEGLDIWGADVNGILSGAKAAVFAAL